MVLLLLALSTLASLSLVTGQLNPFFFPQAAGKQLRSALPQECPNGLPQVNMDLPSPLPTGLQNALNGLKDFLNATVDPSFPALGLKPQAAALQLDYRGEKLINVFVGEKDPKTKSGPPDEDTIFRIGSVSKIFPVLMLYQLLDQGVVSSLDDPLSKYAPDFKLSNDFSHARRQFTLRQLASQLSGMQRELPCNMFNCKLKTKDIIDRLSDSPGAQFSEYTQPSYSNAAYALLGNVLADYIKVPFEDYIEQHILKPLGMHSTGFVFTEEIEQRMAKPYSNRTVIPNYDIGYNAPAGQMYSNIKDLMTLGRYYLGISGHLFDDGLRRELILPGFIWRDGHFLQGAPWEIQQLKGNWLMVGKGGNVPGHSAVFGLIPPLNLSFAALWTGAFDETSFVAEAYERVLPELVPLLKSSAPAPSMPEDPSKYAGAYHMTDSVMGNVDIAIAYESLPSGKHALALHNGDGELGGWLSFRNAKAATVGTNGVDFPGNCFKEMAMAQTNLWLTFDLADDGRVTSLEMPGEFYGVKFVKKDQDVSPTRVVV